MDRGARYTVRTQYGCFSLDEASYRDYLAGKLWINWPLERSGKPDVETAAPLNVSAKALQLREKVSKPRHINHPPVLKNSTGGMSNFTYFVVIEEAKFLFYGYEKLPP